MATHTRDRTRGRPGRGVSAQPRTQPQDGGGVLPGVGPVSRLPGPPPAGREAQWLTSKIRTAVDSARPQLASTCSKAATVTAPPRTILGERVNRLALCFKLVSVSGSVVPVEAAPAPPCSRTPWDRRGSGPATGSHHRSQQWGSTQGHRVCWGGGVGAHWGDTSTSCWQLAAQRTVVDGPPGPGPPSVTGSVGGAPCHCNHHKGWVRVRCV